MSLKQGKLLAIARDSRTRKLEDMSAPEQQILENFETQDLKKNEEASAKRLPLFRGQRNATATQCMTDAASSTEPLLQSMDAAGSL